MIQQGKHGLLSKLRGIFKRKTLSQQGAEDVFRRKYTLFQELLASNAENLDLMADMEEKLKGDTIFGTMYVRSAAARAVFHTHRMVRALEDLSGGSYSALWRALEELSSRIREEIQKPTQELKQDLVLPYREIASDSVDLVGAKNANLAEVKNKVDLPIPEGFAITTSAFRLFMEYNDLPEEISKLQMEILPDDPKSLTEMSEEIQRRILLARIPPELERAILQAHHRFLGKESRGLAMRSSATGEDMGGLSFAGQYLSSLNVPPGQILNTYKVIVGSLYTPRAISYRLHKGIKEEEQAMAVACLEMVEARASGIIYSLNPSDPEDPRIWISAVWGLGPYAVGGVISPDIYLVERSRETPRVEATISRKPMMLTCRPGGGLQELPVENGLVGAPCLSTEQILELARYLLLLEEHFGGPQDVEWALDPQGRFFILQCRPLTPSGPSQRRITFKSRPLEGHKVILQGDAIACPGVGSGPAFHVRSEEDLSKFPQGAVLVAAQPSPKFMLVLPKAQAVLTDHGSITGHMASLAREFSVPTIVGLKEATSRITQGMIVTVDAHSGRIYQGRVVELLDEQTSRRPFMVDTPVHRTLKRIAQWIVPLHLVDPHSPDFKPEACSSLHDIMRFVHEVSYGEMFRISDLVSEQTGGAVRLRAKVPIDLHIIDLGGGLQGMNPGQKEVGLGNIASLPLTALLRGMTHEGLQFQEPRPIEWRGLFSVMTEQMLTNPLASERFGERSFAIISDRYMNFSSRVGYHYGVLDTYCGQTLSKNYITFSFQGGAADDVRRNRRARVIARVLEELGFSVEVRGDRVTARLRKRDRASLEEKLDFIGKLLVFTRQMDMLMHSDGVVEIVSHAFLEGDYRCDALLGQSESHRHNQGRKA
ncbi:MAG: PEP/pyruvate-binding domain-containing protein [Thermodesulfobacteriota bacterium]